MNTELLNTARIENEQQTQVIETKAFPFVIVKVNKTYRIAAGNTFMSNKVFKTLAGAKMYLYARPIDLLVNFICKTVEISKS